MRQMEIAPMGETVDPEVFRRVWSRVMADGAERPIAVEEGQAPPAAPPPAGPQPEGRGEERQAPSGDGALLLRGLEELGRGLALARGAARRPGRPGPGLSALLADYRRAARQLSAACFLLTGARQTLPAGGPTPADPAQALRALYWWERGWSGWCLEAAGQAEDPFLQELCRTLAQTGQVHLGIIRGVLEQLQGPALDGGRGRGVN